MNDMIYLTGAIAVIALVTWALRALPFILFGNRPLPDTVKYLGRVLPPAIMTILVIYCLRDTKLTAFPFGIPELVSCLMIIILQAVKKNMYLSIIAGTACYMLLIRLI